MKKKMIAFVLSVALVFSCGGTAFAGESNDTVGVLSDEEDTRDWDTVCVGNSTTITISSSTNQTYTFTCADGAAVSAVLVGQSSSVVSVGGVSQGTYSKTYRVTVTAIGKHVLNIVGSAGSSNEYYLEVLDHDYTGTEVTEATCTEDGYITYTCSRCGYSYIEVYLF